MCRLNGRTMQKAIQVESSAQAALAAASGTRALGFIKNSEGHIPSGFGSYNYNLNAIDNLLDPNGPYLPTLRLYHIKPFVGSDAPEVDTDLPPASLIPNHHERTFDNGKTYQNIDGVVSEVR